MALRREPTAPAREVTQAQAHPKDSDDDDLFDDGRELGSAFDTSVSLLSAKDKALAASFQRRSSGGDMDDVETKPLTPLQKTMTNGKELKSARVHEYERKLEGLCAAFNRAGDMLAVGTATSRVLLINPHTGNTMNVLDLSSGLKDPPPAITAVRFRPDQASAQVQNVILVAQGDQVLHLHAGTGTVLARLTQAGDKINNISVQGEGDMFATCSSSKAVHVYDEHAQACVAVLDHGDDINTTGHSNCVYGLAFKPDDPQLIVSGGWDKTLQIWDLRVHRSVRSIYGPYVCGDAVDVKGNTILAGSHRYRHPLQLWDLRTSQLLTNLPFYQPSLDACLLYSAKYGSGGMDGVIFAGGGGRGPCVKMFQQTGELIGTMPLASAVHSIDVVGAPRAKMVAVCCAAQVHIMDFSP